MGTRYRRLHAAELTGCRPHVLTYLIDSGQLRPERDVTGRYVYDDDLIAEARRLLAGRRRGGREFGSQIGASPAVSEV